MFIAINLILHSTYFIFNQIVFHQTNVSTMGSPLSPLFAGICTKLVFPHSIWTNLLRYADNIFYIILVSEVNNMAPIFHNYLS